MGRYYSSNNFDGKFGFGVQSSDDPSIFGMEEQEPSEITYYLEGTDEAKAHCKKVIDEQYDFLGVAQEDRVYEIEKGGDIWELEEKYYDSGFREWTEELDKGKIPYSSDKWKNGAVEIKDGIELAWCRVSLGCRIYSDLVKDGYCELTAEL